MGMIGRVISSEVKKNKDSDNLVLMLVVEMSEPGDNQEVENFRLSGIDCKPPVGSHVLVEKAGAFQFVSGCDDNVAQDVAEGEIEIYASEDGSKTARVHCEAGGDVVMNQGSRSTARKEDETLVDATTDPEMIAWMTTVSGALTSLGITVNPPTSITGKVNDGTDEVKVP
jgi:hypothetical protein